MASKFKVLDRPLAELNANQCVRAIETGKISAVELTRAIFRQIDSVEDAIHAWVCVDEAQAMNTARSIDEHVAAGRKIGPLGGVAVGVKDIFNVRGMPCQMGSPLWHNFRPGNDARVVHYLRMAGAVIPGKTVTAEFAVHAPGPTENPHRRNYTPGTSSSGSAAAVAANMVPVAIGTQTAGSIIRPASYCGVFGMKPSFGAVPRTGMLKTTDTLDTVGWFARDVEDLALLFETLRVKGPDFPLAEAAFADEHRQKPVTKGVWNVALCHGPKWKDTPSSTREAVEAFAQTLGRMAQFTVTTIDTPSIFDDAHSIHSTIYDRALAYYFKEEFRQHSLVSELMYEIIERGNRLTVEDYRGALANQNIVACAADELLQRFDVLIDIATATEAKENLASADGPDHSLIWTLCRVPTVSAPLLTGPTGLPLGIQFIARRFSDPKLLNFLGQLASLDLLPDRTHPRPAILSSMTCKDLPE